MTLPFSPARDKTAAARAVVGRLADRISPNRLMTDPLYTYAYSGDASSYRLIPALVVIVNTEGEVRAVLAAARAEGLSVTFRAAGTSLSGQAITDNVLCVLGDGWRTMTILDQGDQVTLGPAMIVANVNKALKPFNRKLGPDPASQATCKIGGVVANNSSGMCCGVAYNTYHTMVRLRFMLADGTVVDSGDTVSRDAFIASHRPLLDALHALHHEVMADPDLVDLIRRKYRIKNTVGYSLNALVDFHDPFDILIHLLVGSEGTLAFTSEVTYRTIPEHPFKSTGLIPFPDPQSAGRAIIRLSNGGVQTTSGVTAAEYIERRALATVQHLPAMAPLLPYLTETSPAVLIDITAPTAAELQAEVEKAVAILAGEGATALDFSPDPEKSDALWDIRKGFFASGGAARPKGTSMLTEDVAAPIDRLADFVIDMRRLLDDHGYDDAIIFGHALAGNLHFQMSDDFAAPGAAEKFDAFSKDLSELVSVRYQGSLKAEHGTGRAIAPFVEAEWGRKAYQLMQRIKLLFDPDDFLNPGVLIAKDDKVHIKNLKAMPLADEKVDLCIECGFCEPACPSLQMTLSPRQRIAVTRERARLRRSGENPERLKALDEGFQYAGLDTCAACNLCSLRCPVGIETGTMIIGQRSERRGPTAKTLARWTAANTGIVESLMTAAVATQAKARDMLGDTPVDTIAKGLRTVTGGAVPRVSRALRPGTTPEPSGTRGKADAPRGKIVYFPACPNRMFGTPKTGYDLLPTTEAMLALLERAGYEPVVPEHLNGQCCGQPFLSKGFPEQSKTVGDALAQTLAELSDQGSCSIVTDASTCTKHLGQHHGELGAQDSADFLLKEVLPYLTVVKKLPILAVHHNCSAQRLKEQASIERLAGAISERVAVLSSITCCGYAGDKGLFVPELNAHATRFAKNDVPADCTIGVSTVSTCASGLSERAGVPFASFASLLELVSRPQWNG